LLPFTLDLIPVHTSSFPQHGFTVRNGFEPGQIK
jgi:hypothetical protein